MIGRALAFLALLPLSALAQIQLVQFDGVNENPVGTTFSVGTAAPGDTLPTRFRVRNTGTAPATLQTLSLAGAGFQITSAPALPYIIAPGSEAEFDVAFSPQLTGSYSAFLSVNTIMVTLKGTSAPDASLMLAGSAAPLMTASVVNFGSVAEGSTQLQGFMLFNAGSGSVTVNTLAVSGAGFHGPIGLAAPVQLARARPPPFKSPLSRSPRPRHRAYSHWTSEPSIFKARVLLRSPPELPSDSPRRFSVVRNRTASQLRLHPHLWQM